MHRDYSATVHCDIRRLALYFFGRLRSLLELGRVLLSRLPSIGELPSPLACARNPSSFFWQSRKAALSFSSGFYRGQTSIRSRISSRRFLSAPLIRCSYFFGSAGRSFVSLLRRRLIITIYMLNIMESKNENLLTNPYSGDRPDCDRDYSSSSNARRETPSGILNHDLQLHI